ncbi:ABC transporter substrate-binding protein [Yinghuangia soli]|uniref:ABC transporter substrate-binding protein n=1 Tax=Yinghuangia soli TaxID=2908204 RepID=A0AA41PWQ4_9ACTN|nr:ABC transporter substrate-binding protein [Yinghuangia soli]MCF2527318.1 ABC transporter substrate-binding protein [Yinghuangia soli]
MPPISAPRPGPRPRPRAASLPHGPRPAARFAALAAAAALALAATGCGGSSSGGSGGKGETLNLIAMSPPASLDPAKANVGSDNWFVNLAYDSLIHREASGKLVPGLAVMWGYVGNGNTDFELTLREGAVFADGTPVTAQAVAASLDYTRKNGLNVSWLSAIESVTATGPLTIRIHCASANPILPDLFTQVTMAGSVVSPAGLADPAKMGTQSYGSGPYVLDGKATVTGDHYTYTPNPKYWDPSKIKWKKVVVKVVPNPQSALQAVKTGQADALAIGPNQVDAAKSGGLEITKTPAVLMGVNLADRAGTVAKPLSDVRVRQALNHAIDRDAINKALFQGYAQSTTQVSLPGLDGFSAETDKRYPYDPAKAKKLLADAGYPNGFSFPMETQNLLGIDLVTQAVVEQWKQIGVRAEVTTDTTVGQWLGNATSKKFPVLGFGYGGIPTYMLSLDWMLPHATAFNPYASEDPELTRRLAAAAAVPAEQQPALYQEAMRYAVDQAWFVATSRIDGIYAFNPKKLSGFTTGTGYLPDVAWDTTPA